jgi:hypothetical protein
MRSFKPSSKTSLPSLSGGGYAAAESTSASVITMPKNIPNQMSGPAFNSDHTS